MRLNLAVCDLGTAEAHPSQVLLHKVGGDAHRFLGACLVLKNGERGSRTLTGVEPIAVSVKVVVASVMPYPRAVSASQGQVFRD